MKKTPNQEELGPKEPVRVAQVGVGYWGPNLLRNLVSSPRFSVTRVVEQSTERQEFVSRLYPELNISSEFESACSDPQVEGVIIATPVASHADLTIKALHAGKHVLVEKPMATTTEEVAEIEHLSRANNLVAMVGHTFLFNNAVRQIKEIVDSGEIGQIRYIYARRLNLGRIRRDVDALWNLAPHDVSIIQYWLDDPDPLRVQRTGMAYVQKGIDDVVFLNIHYPGGILANIHVSWLDPHKVRQITVVGEKKMIVYDDIAENKIALYDKGIDKLAVLGADMDFDEGSAPEFTHRSGDVVLPKVPWREPLQNEVDHFADCIRNCKPCRANATHAKNVVSILSSAKQI